MSLYIHNMKQLNESLVQAGTNLVLIDFFANWCGPCKEIAPKLDELGKKLGDVMIIKINVDECEDIVEAYDINVLPTFVFIRSKQKLETFSGNDFEKLKEMTIRLNQTRGSPAGQSQRHQARQQIPQLQSQGTVQVPHQPHALHQQLQSQANIQHQPQPQSQPSIQREMSARPRPPSQVPRTPERR